MESLSVSELEQVYSQIQEQVDKDFNEALACDNFDDLLIKYGIKTSKRIAKSSDTSLVTRRSKILVIGRLIGNKDDYLKAASKVGISSKNIEFMDYDDLKHYSIENFRYSNKYSDIIAGPMAHSAVGLDGNSSLIGMIENASDKDEYPNLIRMTTNMEGNTLKSSINAFREALLKTNLIVKLNEIS